MYLGVYLGVYSGVYWGLCLGLYLGVYLSMYWGLCLGMYLDMCSGTYLVVLSRRKDSKEVGLVGEAGVKMKVVGSLRRNVYLEYFFL